MVFQLRCCCPFLIQQWRRRKKKWKKKHKRKKLNGWCPLGHNDKLWYDIKMPPSLLQKSDQANLQLWQRDLSSRILLPTHTQLVCSMAPVQCGHRSDGIENKGKRWHHTDLVVFSHHHHHHYHYHHRHHHQLMVSIFQPAVIFQERNVWQLKKHTSYKHFLSKDAACKIMPIPVASRLLFPRWLWWHFQGVAMLRGRQS